MDINGKPTLTGSGINMAQRVMDCGDAGHILVSERVAADLSEFENWASCLKELGVAVVKNDIPIRIFNLIVGAVGNPNPPERVTFYSVPTLPTQKVGVFTAPTVTELDKNETLSTEPVAGNGRRVVLLYKRRDPNGERLLTVIESFLKKQGFHVFVDRHLRMGEEWENEIVSQIRRADMVVVLISENAIHSEMLEYEIEKAVEAGQKQGTPRLLPIRVAYDKKLPKPLASLLDHLQYSLWESEQDDERVLAELMEALAEPQRPRIAGKRGSVGGAVPLDSEFYVVRHTDDEFRDAIAQQDSIVLVKGGRQMGKTSLLARGLHQARQSGAKVVLTDFQSLSAEHFTSADALYRELANMIADQLDLAVLPEEVWNERRGANMNLERYLRREVLGSFEGPMVWGMDEVDRLFKPKFASEVFGMFRSWHNRRALDPAGPWSRLTLAIAYATEAHLFITDLNQSPFNVGTRLSLSDFNPSELTELNRRYGSPLRTSDDYDRFYALIGGQPYLTCRGLDEMALRNMTITTFEEQATQEGGLYDDHLRRVLFSLSEDDGLVEAMRAVLRDEAIPNAESFYKLRSAGLVVGDSVQTARARCRLYELYLQRHLL
jgi:nucleotide-binding universal stress UspA family protein